MELYIGRGNKGPLCLAESDGAHDGVQHTGYITQLPAVFTY